MLSRDEKRGVESVAKSATQGTLEPYVFQGRVLPERAPITLQFSAELSAPANGKHLGVDVSIVLNQIIVWVYTADQWDLFDLRNAVASIVQHHLATVSFLMGRAYDFEISRAVNRSRDVDYVFGIDIPCLAESRQNRDVQEDMRRLIAKSGGIHGVFLSRCFTDLVFAMRHADDTGFYCYRAIEALRNHCVAIHSLESAERSSQWKKFREISGQSEETIKIVAQSAKPLRHGHSIDITDDERVRLLQATWAVVEAYLNAVEPL